MESKFPLYITQDRCFSNSQKAINLCELRKIGELKEGKVIYTSFETLYLLETKKAEIINLRTNKKLSETNLIKLFSKKSNFLTNYIVYKYLKNKGYAIKTGLKFGEEFRVYCNSKKSRDFLACPKHARWIVYPIKSTDKIGPKELISKSRISHSTGKKLLLAIVDSEEDITFYEIDWVKP